jgi:uncharacterized membrane protein
MPPLEPQFFDIFGFLGFIYIILIGILGLRGRPLPKWDFIILLAIGVVGLVVDGFFVYSFYLR